MRRFCGLAVSTLLAVPLAQLHLRALYDALRSAARRRDVQLDALALRDSAWWRDLAKGSSVGRALWPTPPAGEVTTDASPYGWGATFQRLVPARGFFRPAMRDAHINLKERAAVRWGVQSFSHLFWPGATLAGRTDSRVTMGVLNAMCSRSPRPMEDVRRLHDTLHTPGLRVTATWLRSLASAFADRLSRDRDRTDWRLCPAVFATLASAWGPCTIDRSAALQNTQLPRFNTCDLEPECEAVDAWRQPWGGEHNNANNPFSQAALLLRKVVNNKAEQWSC